MKSVLLIALLTSLNTYAATKPAEPNLVGKWTLQASTVTYTVTHLKTVVNGTSNQARGQGECTVNGDCHFLISIPIKSFDSGNATRDQRMLETVQAAKFPMAVVRLEVHPKADMSLPLYTNALVVFAGKEKKMHVDEVKLFRKSDKEIEADLVIPLVLTDFEIELPTLLTVPIEDKVPIHVHGTWTRD